jgi:hypothetical protein
VPLRSELETPMKVKMNDIIENVELMIEIKAICMNI